MTVFKDFGLPNMKELIAFLLLMLLAGTSGRHLNPLPNCEHQATASEKGSLLNEPSSITDDLLVESQEENSEALIAKQELNSDSSPNKQLLGDNGENGLFGNNLFGNGMIGRLWNRIIRRNRRRRYFNFLRRKSNIFLHAASIGTSIAALSTAIALGSSAAYTAENHLHEVALNDEFILEPVFHGKSDVLDKPLLERVFGPGAH